MRNDVEGLLEVLYNMVQDAFSLPLGADRCILNRDKVLSILDEISAQLPEDLKAARKIVESQNDLLSNAKRESEAIHRQADERAKHMISQNEIVQNARRQASEITRAAEKKAREIREAANDYVAAQLKTVEKALATAYNDIKKSHSDFKAAASLKNPPKE